VLRYITSADPLLHSKQSSLFDTVSFMHSLNKQIGSSSAHQLLLLVTLFVATFGGYLYWLSSDSEIDRMIKQLDTQTFNPSEYTFYKDLQNEKYTGIKESIPRLDVLQGRPTSSAESYFIQAGTFRDPSRADQVKAELALLDVGPIAIRGTNFSGGNLNHVLIGPFNSYSLIASKSSKLQAHGHPSIVVKMK
jgi:hypothetical protein